MDENPNVLPLAGRRSEQRDLADIVERLKQGESAAVLIRGDAGIGKTTLLDTLTEGATSCRVVRSAGVESEMELPYAALHQLCSPLLGVLDRLPEAHQKALAAAFGLAPKPRPDQFFLGLATLELLTELAEERPLICIVDDVQWIDRASAQVLGFVARRLESEAFALIFASRARRHEFDGLPELALGGLAQADAIELLDANLRNPLDPDVRQQIVAESQGNPLALIELSRTIKRAGLAGGFAVPTAGRLSGLIEHRFLDEVNELPETSQRLLLLAAAEPTGDAALLWRAAEILGLPGEMATVDRSDLIKFSPRVYFRHPLVRSAVYGAATDRERRLAHRVLGEATDADIDPDRRAWHLSQAAEGTDEDLAEELVRSAGRALSRGGLAAVAAFLARASELTADPVLRAHRLLDAADAEARSGAAESARAMIVRAEAGPLTDLDQARAMLLGGTLAFDATHRTYASSLLLAAAQKLEPFDVRLARGTYLQALTTALWGVGDPAAVAAASMNGPAAPDPPRPADFLLDAWASLVCDGPQLATPLVREALAAVLAERPTPATIGVELPAVAAAAEIWDLDSWSELGRRMVGAARAAGALAYLPLALVTAAGARLFEGEFLEAEAAFEEAMSIAAAAGLATPLYGVILLHSWRGDTAAASRLADPVLEQARAIGDEYSVRLTELALIRVHNAHGEYEQAVAVVPDWQSKALHVNGSLLFGEFIEAAARAGKPELAEHTLRLMSVQTQASRSGWALGEEALARALLGEGEDADRFFRDSLEHLASPRIRWPRARAHLLYGEWLRREGRRTEARPQLREAHQLFTHMRADAFAERAARELLATGETSRRRTPEAEDALTPQERQIALMAAEGLTNRQIGERLYLSHRTIGSHLYRAFPKLKITTRAELSDALVAAAGEA